jgi:iron complex transport system substrate-binding protein
VRFARAFALEERDGVRLARVLTPWKESREVFTFALVPRGQPRPALPPGAIPVEVPIRRLALAARTSISFLPLLGAEEALAGATGLKRITTPEIADRIARGLVREVGVGNDGLSRRLNMERLYALAPDLVVVHATGSAAADVHPKLLEAGLATVIDASYLEPTPLGRAEWIKFYAAFLGREQEAAAFFDRLARDYESLAARARASASRPTAFSGMVYHGTFFGPGGDSYMARFMEDAGADFLWKDDPHRGTIPLSVEAVYARAGQARFWVNPGECRSLAELAATDERLALFESFAAGRVFNNDAIPGPTGSNDVWERGVSRPDLLLADLVSIFHPELLPGHARAWYRQLPAREEGR